MPQAYTAYLLKSILNEHKNDAELLVYQDRECWTSAKDIHIQHIYNVNDITAIKVYKRSQKRETKNSY